MKNKKLLLVATAAMGVLALGTAGVGTLAWYTSTASMSFTKEAMNQSTLTVAENDISERDLKATVHLSATPTNANGVLLSSWKDDGNVLYTNYTDSAGDPHWSTEGKLYEVFSLKMWITRDANSQGTQNEWDTAKAASQKTATYTITLTSHANITAESDVVFWTSTAQDGNTYTKARETAGVAAAKTLAVAIADLPTTESTVQGYLLVRIEGKNQNHVHNTTYSAVFDASGAVA